MNKQDTVKYNQAHITNTPTEKYPTMVTITKTIKRLKGIEGRRFITLKHAQQAVDIERGEMIIERGAKKVKKELQSIGLGS